MERLRRITFMPLTLVTVSTHPSWARPRWAMFDVTMALCLISLYSFWLIVRTLLGAPERCDTRIFLIVRMTGLVWLPFSCRELGNGSYRGISALTYQLNRFEKERFYIYYIGEVLYLLIDNIMVTFSKNLDPFTCALIGT